jgi:ELWxxDGT repeat protein
LVALAALAQAPGKGHLVKNIDDHPDYTPHGLIWGFAAAVDQVFFSATVEGADGLWRTDGTEEGTRFFASALSDAIAVADWDPAAFRVLGGQAWYRHSYDGGIFLSDGTPGGSRQVAGQLPVAQRPQDPSNLVQVAESSWLFVARSDESGFELWTTDGTAEGSAPLVDLEPGPGSGVAVGSPRLLASAGGGGLFLRSFPAGTSTRQELWFSDGTAAGTRQVSDLGDSYQQFLYPFQAQRSLFLRRPAGGEYRLWATDGSAAGTLPLPFPGADGPSFQVGHLGLFQQGWLLFAAEGSGEALKPCELWKTDGTAQGTTKILDLGSRFQAPPDEAWRQVVCPDFGLAVGDRYFFSFDDGSHGQELWVTDGTAAGTRLVVDLSPDGLLSFLDDFSLWQGELVFSYESYVLRPEGGVESGPRGIYTSDGSAAGTRPVTSARRVTSFAVQGDRILFAASEESRGELEIWETTGDAKTERRVIRLTRQEDSSSPDTFVRLGDRIFFQAREGATGSELWSTDGTAAETKVLDISPGPRGSNFRPLFRDGDRLYGSDICDIWESDGTVEGSQVLATSYSCSDDFTKVRGLVFYASYEDDGTELFVSDGTPEGTRQVADLFPGSGPDPEYPDEVIANSSGPFQFRRWKNLAVFSAENDRVGREIWVSDGTAAGTKPLETYPGIRPSRYVDRGYVYDLLPLGDSLFFLHSEGGLWVTDGTQAGTKAVLSGDGEQLTGNVLVEYRGRCLVLDTGAPSQAIPSRLWLTDGTTAGTRRLAEFPLGSYARGRPVAVGGQLFFSFNTPETGFELGVSDGTPEGTGLVKDVQPGILGSEPRGLRAVDGRLIFSADDGEHGQELWASDGTAEGTRLLADLQPGSISSSPLQFTPLVDQILFAAYRQDVGRELFAIDRSLLAFRCKPAARRLCLQDGRFSVDVDWRSQRQGTFGRGGAVEYSDDTGMFWFFDEANVELLVKVLNGQARNGHHWYFAGALSDVEYWVTVTDHATGQSRTFHNPAGNLCGRAETRAFSEEDAVPDRSLTDFFASTEASAFAVSSPSAVGLPGTAGGTCTAGPDALLLHDGRFAVEVDWQTSRQGGRQGAGQPVAVTEKSGFFWFFNPDNLELVVKILDGRGNNGHFWVLYGALSDVEYQIRVTDLTTCQTRTYRNPEKNVCGRADLRAF